MVRFAGMIIAPERQVSVKINITIKIPTVNTAHIIEGIDGLGKIETQS